MSLCLRPRNFSKPTSAGIQITTWRTRNEITKDNGIWASKGIMSSNTSKSGAQIVVESLERHRVTHVFGIPGAKIDKVFDTLKFSSIETVVCRHEQNAAFIAGGIGRLTGRAGVAIATSGPGVSNLATGLATANSEGDPVVALGGSVPTSQSLKQVHQALQAVSVLKPVTKFCAEVGSSESIGEVIANAFRAAESDRPGAAYVNLPKDIMEREAKCEALDLSANPKFGPGSHESLVAAAKIINGAQRPVLLLGLLASRPENAEAVRAFLRKAELPIVGTFQAAGTVSSDLFKNFAGRIGQLDNTPGDELLSSADVIITVGYDPVEYDPSFWNHSRTARIIHIDSTRADADNFYSPAVEVLGDIAASVSALAALINPLVLAPDVDRFLLALASKRALRVKYSDQYTGNPIHPLRLVAELQKWLTDDVTLCLDMGSFHLWIAHFLFSFRARQILISNGQQTLGVALPWGIASCLVRPNEKTLSISGDGGFLFSAMELETAVRLKLNLVHMVWIDDTYDMVAVQEQPKYKRTSGIKFGPVDVVKLVCPACFVPVTKRHTGMRRARWHEVS
ncbi:acetolactate synthase AlsS, partial [Terracidiphilus gabretensis]|uniref:acetolactate synthase AlsS n=1 Tax=Terracidiphilus gabretensis TaxID=1577687 RepID=UPI002F4164FF